MKTEVYSWRLSEQLKSDLEREARLRKLPLSSMLDLAVRDWLNKKPDDLEDREAQQELHRAASEIFGTLAGGDHHRSETVREAVRKRLKRRNGR